MRDICARLFIICWFESKPSRFELRLECPHGGARLETTDSEIFCAHRFCAQREFEIRNSDRKEIIQVDRKEIFSYDLATPYGLISRPAPIGGELREKL